MKKYNWGIIGTGRICGKFCRALRMLDRANITAVCSRTEEKGKAFAAEYGINNVYTDIAELCADGNVDVIYIGTPHPMHLQAMLTALEAGKHVLCEKPMTLNEQQAQAAIYAAERNGVFLMEAMWTRFLPAVQQVVKWVRAGEIGEVREVMSSYRRDLPEDPASRLYAPELGGGAMLDLGVYPLFAAQLMLEGEAEVLSTEATLSNTGVDMDSTTMLRYPGGRKAYISTGFDYNSNSTIIEGTDGYITVPNWCYTHSAYLFKGTEGTLAESFCQPHENGMQYEAEHVMECLDKGLTQSPDYPLEYTLREMRCCDKLRKAWGVHYPGEDEIISAATADAASEAVSTEDVSTEKHMHSQADDWFKDAVFYHIYPLGMCGAPEYNDFTSQPVDRLSAVGKLLDHIDNIGFDAVYFGPVFESTKHGYDTANYGVIDRRLGTNEQFAQLCRRLHMRGIRVVLDGVFNHVGRDFWAFRDVIANRESSPYRDWFHINFGGNSNYNDGFWYEGWEGHFDLVKLNLHNPEVRKHIFENIRVWEEQFGIDGLRLDVAYCLDEGFIRELHSFCKGLRSDFFLLGECVHGDYRRLINDSMLDSVTNYECYKGIYSSINCGNMHEIGYSLHRQFGSENWCIYRGLNLYTFVDNHDVSRIASIIEKPQHLPVAYALMFAMPGCPSVYYGSELEMRGDKKQGDAALRPELRPEDVRSMRSGLTDWIARLCEARAQSKALCRGDYTQLYVAPQQLVFARSYEGERVICAFNAADAPCTAHFDAGAGRALDLITGKTIDFGGGLEIPANSAFIARVY
ncbi:MAG: hypothetical protein E7559_10025 [Ruminococcaceae bacterium]|nr:hypothetical protein [Oscillospiraceae bacterium]